MLVIRSVCLKDLLKTTLHLQKVQATVTLQNFDSGSSFSYKSTQALFIVIYIVNDENNLQ